jgi:hypothetical protein
MNIRAYETADLEQLRKLHEKQGLGYAFPDLDDGTFVVGAVGCDEQGTAKLGAFLQVTAQAYLLMDGGHGTAMERWRTLLGIHERIRREAERLGFADVQCWLPPELKGVKRFAKRLEELGWSEDKWRNFTYCLRSVQR